MRTTAFLLLASLTATTAVGCKKADPTSAGAGKGGIEGTYTIVGFELGGDKMPPEDFAMFFGKDEAERTFTITKDTITKKSGKDGKDDVQPYKLDPTKSPAEIDITRNRFDGSPETMYGIYKLEGDTLTIVIGGPKKGDNTDDKPDPKHRPKEFKSEKDSMTGVMILKKK